MYTALALTCTAFILFIITGDGYRDNATDVVVNLPQAIVQLDPFAIASLAILVFFASSFLPLFFILINSIIHRDRKLALITAIIAFLISSLIIIVIVRF